MHNRQVIIGSTSHRSPDTPPLAASLFLLLLSSVFCQSGRTTVRLASNYNASLVHGMALVALPLEVPLSLQKHSDPNPIAHVPINEKHSIGLYRPSAASLDLLGLQERMVHVDYQMIYEQNPPNSVFQERYDEEYHLLQIREFFINVANPSEVFSICINQIFSDCESIKKVMKKALPLCINPFTKYPIYFNLYVTHARSREIIKSSIFFNVTLRYSDQPVFNRIWMREVKFTLLPNHLKLLPFQLRNCDNENSVVAIKNPEKTDLSFLLIHKFRKYHMNGQPLDDKFTIASQKTFRFMLEARDSTITIYSKPLEGTSDKTYPVLYVPVFCFQKVVIQNVPVGIISFNNLALTYPILLTSNTNSVVIVEEIALSSSSGAVDLIRNPTHKSQILSIERYVQVASFVVRSSLRPSFKNSITVKVRYSLATPPSGNNSFQAKKVLTYSELMGAISVGENRFYEVSQLPEREYSDLEKILHFNYSVVNKMQIPIRMERIIYNSQKFKMHWFRYSGLYIFPERVKEEIMLEYVGPREIPISPVKYAAAIEFSGGIFVPFQVMVFDRTLACLYQGKETRCSAIRYINFGYQKNEQKVQTQTIVIRNFNPHSVSLTVNRFSNLAKSHGLHLSFLFSQPYPTYRNYSIRSQTQVTIFLHSGHYINLTIQMKILGSPVSGETTLNVSTQYQSFGPKVKFNFEQGRLHFTPTNYLIPFFDRMQEGTLQLLSTFQELYHIREVVSDTIALQFTFDEWEEYQPNQNVTIPFVFDPHSEDNNLTGECCSEQFLKDHYMHSLINYQENTAQNHEVTVITNMDYEQHLNIRIGTRKAALMPHAADSKKASFSGFTIANQAKFCMQVTNPYPTTLKYGLFFIPDAVVYKPKDYQHYFKHATRERTDAFICFPLNKKASNMANSLKQMFKLQQTPLKIQIKVDAMGNIQFDSPQKLNLSSNQYVNTMVQTGDQMCYKMNTFLYFKLLIESEIVNAVLQRHSVEAVERFMEREWEHIQNSSISYLDDEFYKDLKLKFQDYCNSAFFPIFRFCLYYPITLLPLTPTINKKLKPTQQHYLLSNKTQQLCFLVKRGLTSKPQTSYELVIANNYSKFDDYKVELSFVEPKVTVGNIAFQKDHRINNEIFIKHYFSALAKADAAELSNEGIENRYKVIPIYLTSQDYEEEFGLFKGERFFQLENHSPKDIDFSHFGFENRENISEWAGLRIQQVDKEGVVPIQLKRNGRGVFRVHFCLDQPFHFNLTNPYFHKRINLYLYNHDEFYLSLTLLVKVADNVIQKLKVSSPSSPTEGHRAVYFMLNFISVVFIWIVLVNFQREEVEKSRKVQSALQKQKKIVPHKKEHKEDPAGVGFVEERLKQRTRMLLPESIGTKLKNEDEKRYCPLYVVSEEQLAFFKLLKIEKDKSILSESSEDPILRVSNEETEKTQEKSITIGGDLEHSSVHQSQNNEQPSELESQQSLQSLSESILPDGISVCNEQLQTLDQFDDFQFGFESKRKKEQKVKKEDEVGYYDVFSNQDPLKKEKVQAKENPFPWMTKPEKKKSHRPKRVKEEY